MVQLKEFDQHIDEKKCFENVTRKVVRSIVYRGPLDSNGSEKLELKYGLNCSQRKGWVHKCDGKNFYFLEDYLSDKKAYSYAVLMAGINKEEVEAYSIQMVVFSKDEKFKIEFSLPVLPIDSGFDMNYDKLQEEKKIFFVPLYMMKHLFDSKNIVEEEGKKIDIVFYKIKSEIKKNFVMWNSFGQ